MPSDLARALAAHQAGRLAEAEAAYRDILRVRPEDFDALQLLGALEAQRERYEQALLLIERALVINPHSAPAHANLAYALGKTGRHAQALASAERALVLDDAHAEARNNRGNALFALGRYAEALDSYERALALRPAWDEALKNRGGALFALGRYEEAVAIYDALLAQRPGFFEALNDRGAAHFRLGRYEETLRDYADAQAANPAYAEAHWNESICRLLLGDYPRGWKKYEWRWRNAKLNQPLRPFAQPLWLGTEDLRGKSILLHAEQGLGDALHFARYAPQVAALGAAVTLEVFPPLVPLMASLEGVQRIVALGEPLPQTDFHCPLLSLPLAFGTTAQNIPAAIPYLSVGDETVAEARARLEGGGDRLVGVCWRGSASYGGDAERSIAFADFAALLAVPGVRFISLQKELSGEEQGLAQGHAFSHRGGNFQDTAEMVAALDLVITADTVWAHWAGAIGKPFWILLPHTPHWVWLTEREDSPWYPTARLFRQARPGAGWEGVISKVKTELAKWRDTV